MEHNERVCLTEWRVGDGLRRNQNIEGDLCQGFYDHCVRRIMKDGSWDAVASGQPLKGLHSTCEKSAQVVAVVLCVANAGNFTCFSVMSA